MNHIANNDEKKEGEGDQREFILNEFNGTNFYLNWVMKKIPHLSKRSLQKSLLRTTTTDNRGPQENLENFWGKQKSIYVLPFVGDNFASSSGQNQEGQLNPLCPPVPTDLQRWRAKVKLYTIIWVLAKKSLGIICIVIRYYGISNL